jgi:hypothetical protein
MDHDIFNWQHSPEQLSNHIHLLDVMLRKTTVQNSFVTCITGEGIAQ